MGLAQDRARRRAPIDDGFFAPVRGVEHWITLRGTRKANPPLLILTGPGAAFSRMAPYFAPWEADFTLVQWDQPGAGWTLAKNGELPLSMDRLAADAAAVAEIALQRLGHEKLVVLGISGGSIVGLKLAKARPDLAAAYAGTGQIVHWARQAARAYAEGLAAAKARADAQAVAALEGIGPPPYADPIPEFVSSMHLNGFTPAEQAALADPSASAPPAPGARYAPTGLTAPDRTAAASAYAALRGEIAAFDAWALGTDFEIPMAFLQGELDGYTPTPEVAEYAAALKAPAVRLEIIPGGGHSAVFLREPFLARLKAALSHVQANV